MCGSYTVLYRPQTVQLIPLPLKEERGAHSAALLFPLPLPSWSLTHLPALCVDPPLGMRLETRLRCVHFFGDVRRQAT